MLYDWTLKFFRCFVVLVLDFGIFLIVFIYLIGLLFLLYLIFIIC